MEEHGFYQCFEKILSATDVNRNLEIPKGARLLPEGDEVMFVSDQGGRRYQFRASVRSGGRRSMTHQWHYFAMARTLRIGDILRLYRSDYVNEYVVEVKRP
ncbi:unnamed protein product, partial [Ilex paraguariensis]